MIENFKLRIAIIGSGPIGEQHIRAFKKNSKAKVIGVYSRNLFKAKKIANKYKIKIFSNHLNNFINLTRPNLIVIAIPILSTKNLLLKLSKLINKNVFFLIEKPVGYNLNEAKTIIKKIKYPRNYFVGLNRNHYSVTSEILKILKKEKSKRVIKIYDQQSPNNLKSVHPMKVLKNWQFANSIHMIDYIRLFARGNLIKIKNNLPIKNFYFNKKFSLSRKLYFSSGDIIEYNIKWNLPGPWKVEIYTTSKKIFIVPLEKAEIIRVSGKKIKIKEKKNKIKYGFENQANNVISSIFRKKKSYKIENKVPNILDAFITMNYIKKIYN